MSLYSHVGGLFKRLLLTLLVLFVYRLGTYVPLPGVDVSALESLLDSGGGILSMFNLFSGGAFSRMSLFGLSVMPYISASIIMQIMSMSFDSLKELRKQGAIGQSKIDQYTRYLTLGLSLLQGYGLLRTLDGLFSTKVILDPSLMFFVVGTIGLTAGTLFLMWLGQQIDQRGIGSGISLIIFAGILAELPAAFMQLFSLQSAGTFSGLQVFFFLLAVVLILAFIVFVEQSYRGVSLHYPRQQNRAISGRSVSFLPLKVNMANVIPPIFASAVLLFPLTIVNMLYAGGVQADMPVWVSWTVSHLSQGQSLYMLLYVLLIVVFSFFYVPAVFDVSEVAENLKKSGAFIPGIRPGEKTKEYLDHVLTKTIIVGAIYLALVCAVPEIMIAKYSIPFYFGGTSFLIIVSVALDTSVRMRSFFFYRDYNRVMRRSGFVGKS